MDLNEKEFKAFGLNIEKLSLIYGLFLVLWGIAISYISQSSSMTSYIPSYLGFIIMVFSLLSLIFPSQKKIYMHIVALVGLITMLGGLELIRVLFAGSLLENMYADVSKFMMLLTGGYFVYLCFRSFRFARQAKEQNN